MQVLRSPDAASAWQNEGNSMRALAAFVLAHCPPSQVLPSSLKMKTTFSQHALSLLLPLSGTSTDVFAL